MCIYKMSPVLRTVAEWEVRINENQMDLWLFYSMENIIVL